MVGKYRIATLGCKVNQYESQQLRELLSSLGLRPALDDETPDVAIVNTCAVTGAASRKSRQTLRRLTRGGKTAVFVVGCGVAADAERLLSIDGVVAALGHNHDVHAELRVHINQLLGTTPIPEQANREPGRSGRELSDSTALPRDNRYEIRMNPGSFVTTACNSENRLGSNQLNSMQILPGSLPIVKSRSLAIGAINQFDGHQRAFLKVQDGCDAHCTYCIIPRLRSQLRSKPIDDAVAEATGLVAAGHKEIVITGIFLGAFGRETAIRRRFRPNRSPLADLVRALARINGLQRLRLSSLEPGDVDDALLDVLAEEDACVPHLHLPLQAGSGEILRRMNRQYAATDYIAMVDRVREALDRPAITTDIIVGFPGETEADFRQTLDIASYAAFTKIHVFPFSPREGTAAAKWNDRFVESSVTKHRMARLREVEIAGSLTFRQQAAGTIDRVLVEGELENAAIDRTKTKMFHGRTDRYFEVNFEATGLEVGALVNVRIDRATPTRTHATYLPS